MGITYGNITLKKVHQDTLIEYLSEINLDAYVSPTINQFTTVYDKASSYKEKAELDKVAKLDSRSKKILKQYSYEPYAYLICLASHLSEKFSCPALALFIYDGDIFWYHLCENGIMLDEYTTHRDKNWQPGKIINIFTEGKIKGGDAEKLCNAFGVKEKIEQVETILRRPCLNNNKALLDTETYWSPLIRFEELAIALGINPSWVVGPADYAGIVNHDIEVCFELDDVPSFEEALSMLKKTQISSPR